mmetsp:Transcript_19914/g.29793  ORF Transcript_19914/g.29793 Transcript_19914/m.29793 type:complete len:414 (+) Transcript_19914:103-1344(+)|eukprot:CAMPEP_0167763230 /NCGR_PEP_ID=MMETSP0110_2-20121227/13235_1 /TAXON_ID=629695 /ORGANISM="Gymnochlora sp., Strain CCMP2014" /LENGTH=413 /DNA_ID=CAMNT_0007650247 /DNA_START=73 /DNA_END=1314 /DNA_ORIENTATION=+
MSAAREAKATKDELARALYGASIRADKNEKKHKFWNTQPVPQDERPKDKYGEIEQKKVEDIRAKPLRLPAPFEWNDCDMTDAKTVDEVYSLLNGNYVEDDESTFRFDYSREFLKWALCPPGFKKEFHVGVRVKKSKKLVGFITGIPARVQVYESTKKMVEINFLCVHKKLRSKRLAPVLIREITRRVNRTNVWQAVYTAGVVLPRPVSKNRYYHRSLNPKKLIGIGFSRLQPLMTLARTIKLYKVPKTPQTPGIRQFNPQTDAKQCQEILMKYLKNFKLYQEFDVAEFKHWFTPRKGVVSTYVVADSKGKISDFISFYSLPSSILNNPRYKTLRAAYSFYNVSTKTPWKNLMTDALILANKAEFDVFNALDVMENEKFMKQLKFGIGDGHLQYYVYNWNCPEMAAKDVGLVLL